MRPITSLFMLRFQIDRILDEGGIVSLAEMKNAIEEQRALELLQSRFPDQVDLSAHEEDDVRSDIEADLYGLDHAYGASEFGIENNGLVLLSSYLTELAQQEAREE